MYIFSEFVSKYKYLGMLVRSTLVRSNVSEERIVSIMRVTKIGELGTMLAVTSSRSTLPRNVCSYKSHTV
jgi:hypothetical protein